MPRKTIGEKINEAQDASGTNPAYALAHSNDLTDAEFDVAFAAEVETPPTPEEPATEDQSRDRATARADVQEAITLANDARERGDHDEADRIVAFLTDFDTSRLDPDDVLPMADAMAAIPKRPEPEPEPKPKRSRARKAPAKTPDISAAFDSGARLAVPEPTATDPGGALPGAVTADRSKRSRSKPLVGAGTRSPGSDQFTGLFAAGLITLISFSLGEDFQPTEQEATDLARPLGNIMARRIDLAAKLGEDANDVVAFAIAFMAYSVRVGPIVAGKARAWNDSRQSRSRGRSGVLPGGVGDAAGEGGVSLGEDVGTRASNGAPYDPFDALAQVARVGHGVIGRDLGNPANGSAPVADRGVAQ